MPIAEFGTVARVCFNRDEEPGLPAVWSEFVRREKPLEWTRRCAEAATLPWRQAEALAVRVGGHVVYPGVVRERGRPTPQVAETRLERYHRTLERLHLD